MNNCQVKRFEEAIAFTLLPFHSRALCEIKDFRFDNSSVLCLQTVPVLVDNPWQSVTNNVVNI